MYNIILTTRYIEFQLNHLAKILDNYFTLNEIIDYFKSALWIIPHFKFRESSLTL